MANKLSISSLGNYLFPYRFVLFPLLIIIIFHQIFLELLDKYIIPIVSQIPNNNLIIAFCILVTSLLVCLLNYKQVYKVKYLISQSLLIEVCIISIHQILKHKYHYIAYSYLNFDYVYISLFPFLLAEVNRIFMIYKERILNNSGKDESSNNHFLIDVPCSDESHVKERGVYAEFLIQYIFGTYNSYKKNYSQSNPFTDIGSFVINISEEYGYGKTSFFALIHQKLTENRTNQYISFCYRPWLCESESAMVSELFCIFKEKLSPYNPRINKNIVNYLKVLLDKSDNVFMHFFKTILNQSPSMQEERKELKEAIIKIGKPIIVFIDDVDRLQKEELLTLVNLVRDTADFQNVFYIMAADKIHLINSLKDCNISNPINYLKKIINYEFMLPANDKLIYTTLNKKLKNILNKYITEENTSKQENKLDNIVNSITNHDNIESVFNNIRDIKRLLNDYMLTLTVIKSGVKEEIDYKDLFLLTIIKMLRPDVYISLRENDDQLLDLRNDVYFFKTEYANNVHNEEIERIIRKAANILTNKNIEQEDKEICKTIDDMMIQSQKTSDLFVAESLRYLFNEQRTLGDEIRIKYKESYYRYFSGQFKQTQLSSLEVMVILKHDEDEFQECIKTIHKTNKTDSFLTRIHEWSKKWESSPFLFIRKIYMFSKIDFPIEYSKKSIDIREHEYADNIYYKNRIRYSQILRNLYNDKTNNSIDVNEKKLLHEFIMEKEHYVFSAITLNILSEQSSDNLIIKKSEFTSWRKELIISFIDNFIKNDANPFKDEILDVIPIIKGGFINSLWEKEFAYYLNNIPNYMIWFEKLIIYEHESNSFIRNNKYMKQLGFDLYANLLDFIKKCNIEIQQDIRIKDLIELLRMGEIENNIEKHPFLQYIKEKSTN